MCLTQRQSSSFLNLKYSHWQLGWKHALEILLRTQAVPQLPPSRKNHARKIPKKFIRFRGGTVLPLVLYSTRGKYGTAPGQENQRPVCVRFNGWTDSLWKLILAQITFYLLPKPHVIPDNPKTQRCYLSMRLLYLNYRKDCKTIFRTRMLRPRDANASSSIERAHTAAAGWPERWLSHRKNCAMRRLVLQNKC